MTYFHLSTVYTVILTCNLLLAIISVIIRNEKVMLTVGYKLTATFLFLTLLRFLLPFEVPFATTIPLPEGISRVITLIFQPLFVVGETEIIPLHLILTIWLIGILIQGYRYYRANRKFSSYIVSCGKNVSDEPQYADFIAQNQDVAAFQIYELPVLQTPLLYGFFRPYILLPADYVCSHKELGYIIRHEVMHHKHHDLLIKCLARILSIIYWWNPFCYLLNKQIDLVLEMRIDDAVSGLDNTEISEYLHTLLNLADYQDTTFPGPLGNVISFSQCNNKVLTKRFHMILYGRNRKYPGVNLILTGIVVIIYVCSYLFSVEPYYFSQEEHSSSIVVTEVNSFLVDNGDGTYDFYYGIYKIETVDSLEYYSDDIPIYTKEEFEHVQQEASE